MIRNSEKCCICGQPLAGRYANNPWPLAEDGQCCDKCNIKVVEKRIRMSGIKFPHTKEKANEQQII